MRRELFLEPVESDMTISPSELFAARVPRYTSYPSAPHFRTDIGEQNYRNWLAELPENSSLSLYIHIPFCDTLCWFCGCNTTVVNHYRPVRGYLDVLFQEMEMVVRALKPSHRVTHLHFGGGSPTLLTPDDFWRLNARLQKRFNIDPDAEIAIEIDPRGFSREMADTLGRCGVTRASIGVQDCDPAVQRAINRIQPDWVTAAAVDALRGAGIDQLNMDVIYGLPHQTLEGLRRTLGAVLALKPQRLAVFGYAHVPGFKKHMALISEDALPGVGDRFAQAELTNEVLVSRGYVPIGIDHFAVPDDRLAIALREGRLARNFQGYTTDAASALIGLGASAIGSLPAGHVQNFSDVPSWRAAITKSELPIAKGVGLTDEDRARGAVIEQLMCYLACDTGDIAGRYGVPNTMFAAPFESLSALKRDGIVSVEGGKVSIAPRWRSATRLVAAAFDNYLDESQRRHAHAI